MNTDLTPLADCPALNHLTLPPNAKAIELLRAFPKLERLGHQELTDPGTCRPAQITAEFWKEYDAGKKLSVER